MADGLADIGIVGLKGRFGTSSPFECPADQCIEAMNIDWYRSSMGRKRAGATAISMTGGTNKSAPVQWMHGHRPSATPGDSILFYASTGAPQFKRKTVAGAFADTTAADSITSDFMFINGITFNTKMFVAYGSAVNRLHVWDPVDATIRRVGLATPAAPTVADFGAGAYAATIRYYKQAYAVLDGSGNIRYRSELSSSVSFTPSGAGAAARITMSAAISEGETHWLLYASPDNTNFVLIGTFLVAANIQDDTATPANYSGTAAPIPGTFTPPPSAKYLATDNHRVIMAGGYGGSGTSAMATSDKRVWWTGAPGSTDQGDDERISNTATIKNYLDVEDYVTGLGGPIEGAMYIFSARFHWRMTPTGVAEAPYLYYRVTGSRGCVSHRTILVAEDENGAPCVYWLSSEGIYRTGDRGQQLVSEDIQDVWDDLWKASLVEAWGLHYSAKRQIWWYVPYDDDDDPDLKVVFDTRFGRTTTGNIIRGGWSLHNGESTKALHGCLFPGSSTPQQGSQFVPFVGYNDASNDIILQCDTGTQDHSENYQAYITTRPYTPWGFGNKGAIVEDATVSAEKPSSDVTLAVTVIADFGEVEILKSVTLDSTATGSRVIMHVEDTRIADAHVVQFTIGEQAAANNALWNLDAMTIPVVRAGV